jgi:hypothetical protein
MDKTEDPLKQWTMFALTLLFVVLYACGVRGVVWTPNDAIVKIVQPILAVIIGYYFGRMPSERNERTLKEEIGRVGQEATRARTDKETALRDQTKAQEKLDNVKEVLKTSTPSQETTEGFVRSLSGGGAVNAEALRHSVAAALRMLER